MTQLPRLADVQCNRVQFRPGDRVLVRVYQQLDRDALERLRKTVVRWTGPDVEVLIVDGSRMEVQIEHGTP